jgi:peptidoglycan/xylan/chitin deacetylase (PgdA/CDA1 family)
VASHRRFTDQLLAGLQAHGIPATGFVNGSGAERGGKLEPARVELLERWLEAGHDLANHTFAHLDLHAVPAAAFEADIVRGETFVCDVMGARGREPVWFRHPYLHTGTDLATKQRIDRFITDRGSRVAPVTVYGQDWLFAAAFDRMRARGDARAAAGIAAAWVPHLERQFEFFEQLSQELLGREMRQVLLLHANSLNAERIVELGAMLRRRGYEFVPLERALADPAFSLPDGYVGGDSVGWLERLALARENGPSLLEPRPRTPRSVRVRAEVGRVERLRLSLVHHARTAVRSAKRVLRATGVLPCVRRPAA